LFLADEEDVTPNLGNGRTETGPLPLRQYALESIANLTGEEDALDTDTVRQDFESAQPASLPHFERDEALEDARESFNDPTVQRLIDLMSSEEGRAGREIFGRLNQMESFDEYQDALADLDRSGLARLQMFFERNAQAIRDAALETDEVLDNINAPEDADDLKRVLESDDNDVELRDRLNRYQRNRLLNVMDDVSGDGGRGSIASTRESIGLGIVQELFDTDPDEEASRYNALQESLQEVFRPESGFQTSILNTERGQQNLADVINNNVPDDALGGNADDVDGGIGRVIANELDRDNLNVDDFLGPEGIDTGDYIRTRLEGKFGNLDGVDVDEITRVVESQGIPRLLQLVGARNARGVTAAAMQDEDARIRDLIPDARQSSADMSNVSNSQMTLEELIDSKFEAFFGSQSRELESLREFQEGQPILQGGAISGPAAEATNQRERRSGLVGEVLGSLADEQSQIAGNRRLGRIFDRLTGTAGGADPDTLVRTNKRINAVRKGYGKLLPVLDATSANIGAFNVNISSTAVLVTKLTAVLGPLITAFGGVAAGALTAAGALGAFVGVGAVEYLGAMEDHMAGISDKQEAVQQLGEVLSDMAFEALTPLRAAQIGGDGASAMQLFVRSIRNGLRLLNNFANVAAYIIELDVVGTELREVADLLFNSDLGYAEAFEQLLNQTLPLLSRMLQGVIAGLPGLLEFMAPIAGRLGERFLDLLSEAGPLLGLLTSYGAGFFDVVLLGVTYLADFVEQMTNIINFGLELANVLGIAEIQTNDLMYAIGSVVGAMFLASKVAKTLAAANYALTAAMKVLTASSLTTAGALKLVGINLLIIAGVFVMAKRAFSNFTSVFDDEIGPVQKAKNVIAGLTQSLLGLTGLVASGIISKPLFGKAFDFGLDVILKILDAIEYLMKIGSKARALFSRVFQGAARLASPLFNLFGRIIPLLGKIVPLVEKIGKTSFSIGTKIPGLSRVLSFLSAALKLGKVIPGLGQILLAIELLYNIIMFLFTGKFPIIEDLKWILGKLQDIFGGTSVETARQNAMITSASPAGGESQFVGSQRFRNDNSTSSDSSDNSRQGGNPTQSAGSMTYNDITINAEGTDERSMKRYVKRALKKKERDTTQENK
jgi:hypothetical protein